MESRSNPASGHYMLTSPAARTLLVAGVLAAIFFSLLGLLWQHDSVHGLLSGIRDWAVENATPIAAILGHDDSTYWGVSFLLVLLFFYKLQLTESLGFHLLAPFDTELLSPIQHYTGLLRWTGPQGSQKHAWDELKIWATSGMGGDWKRITPQLEQPFSWSLLIGPNGQGKTQLAMELALELQRPKDGSVSDGLKGRMERLRHRFKAWWRRRESDPWDSGFLNEEKVETAKKLETWRPRRPTLLLLDDPKAQEVSSIIKILLGNKATFHHPVRLLIIDQSIPISLPLKETSDGWTCEVKGKDRQAFGMLVKLGDVRFAAEACGHLALSATEEGTASAEPVEFRQLWRMDNRNAFHQITRGDPVITGLAAHWLAKPGNSLKDLTEGGVIDAEKSTTREVADRDRLGRGAHRVILARTEELLNTLQTSAGFQANHLEALCCSSLTGGLPLTEEVRKSFGLNDLVNVLAKAFPHAPEVVAWQTGKQFVLPPVRPHFVAEALLTQIAPRELGYEEKKLPDFLKSMVTRAWQLHPQGIMRTLTRHRWHHSDLLAALKIIPDDVTEQIALAFCEAAILDDRALTAAITALLGAQKKYQTIDWVEFAEQIRGMSMRSDARMPAAIVLYMVAMLPLPEDVLMKHYPMLHDMLKDHWKGLQLFYPPGSDDKLREPPAGEILHDFLKKFSVMLLKSISTLEHCKHVAHFFQLISMLSPHSGYSFGRYVSPAEDLTPIQNAMVWLTELGELVERSKIDDFSARMEKLTELAQRDRIWFELKAWASFVLLCPEVPSKDDLTPLDLRLKFIADTFPALAADRQIQLQQVEIWRVLNQRLCFNHWVKETREAAEKVEAIVTARPEFHADREMQAHRAAAWSNLTVASSQNNLIKETREAAEKVETIAALPEYNEDREMQNCRAVAWANLTMASTGNNLIKETREAAEKVETIVIAHPEYQADRDMQIILATAWSNLALAYANHHQVEETRQAAEKVEAIVTARPEYREDRDMQVQRVQVWRDLAVACGHRNQVEETREAAEKVEVIVTARPEYREDRDMQAERAQVWRNLAYACANHYQVEETRQAAEKVEAIVTARPEYREDRDMQVERAQAWRNLAYACANHHQVEETRQAAEKVEAIVTVRPEYREDRDMQVQRAQVWRDLAAACGHRHQVEETREAVKKVEVIVTARPEYLVDREVQYLRAVAWRFLAFACANRHLVEETREAAEKVEVIVTARPEYIDDKYMNIEREEARRALTLSFSNQGQGG